MNAIVRKGSYGHRITHIAGVFFRLHWTVDYKVKGSRIRHQRAGSCSTTRDGAERFAKKWGVKMPRVPGQPA